MRIFPNIFFIRPINLFLLINRIFCCCWHFQWQADWMRMAVPYLCTCDTNFKLSHRKMMHFTRRKPLNVYIELYYNQSKPKFFWNSYQVVWNNQERKRERRRKSQKERESAKSIPQNTLLFRILMDLSRKKSLFFSFVHFSCPTVKLK